MYYKILPTKEFSKDFQRLDKNNQLQIKKKIEEAAENPGRYKHLHYDLKGSSRLRVGNYSEFFAVDAIPRIFIAHLVLFFVQ